MFLAKRKMMSFRNLSVVVPVYNAESYILDILKILIRIPNISVILVDDGSSDSTMLIAENFIKETKLAMWKIVKSDHKGVSNARNIGISKVGTKYVMFVDSDDSLDVESFLRLENYLCDDFDFLSAGIVHSDEFLNNVSRNHKKALILNMIGVKSDFKMNSNNRLSCPGPYSKIFSVDLLLRNEICFPENVQHGEDIIFNALVIKHMENVLFSSESIYLYRENMDSVSKAIKYDVVTNHKNFTINIMNICDYGLGLTPREKKTIELMCKINDNTTLILQNDHSKLMPLRLSGIGWPLVPFNKKVQIILLRLGCKKVIKKLVMFNRNIRVKPQEIAGDRVQRY